MGLGRTIGRALFGAAKKKLADKARKTKVGSLGRKIYKYSDPVAKYGGGASNALFFSTPDDLDQDSFNKFYEMLKEEGLVKDADGLNDGVLDPNDVANYWNQHSYQNRNRAKSWGQQILTEASNFIPYVGLGVSMGLGEGFDRNSDSEDERLYQEIRRQAYKGRGMEVPEYNPEGE